MDSRWEWSFSCALCYFECEAWQEGPWHNTCPDVTASKYYRLTSTTCSLPLPIVVVLGAPTGTVIHVWDLVLIYLEILKVLFHFHRCSDDCLKTDLLFSPFWCQTVLELYVLSPLPQSCRYLLASCCEHCYHCYNLRFRALIILSHVGYQTLTFRHFHCYCCECYVCVLLHVTLVSVMVKEPSLCAQYYTKRLNEMT